MISKERKVLSFPGHKTAKRKAEVDSGCARKGTDCHAIWKAKAASSQAVLVFVTAHSPNPQPLPQSHAGGSVLSFEAD